MFAISLLYGAIGGLLRALTGYIEAKTIKFEDIDWRKLLTSVGRGALVAFTFANLGPELPDPFTISAEVSQQWLFLVAAGGFLDVAIHELWKSYLYSKAEVPVMDDEENVPPQNFS